MMKLPRSTLQPLADWIADKLPTWKGRLLHRSGRLTLIKMTLYAISIYTSISVKVLVWLLKAIQKTLKSFLWSGTEAIQSSKCIVA
jgi:hypothetical protein